MPEIDAVDLIRALGLALVIEGALYALFPDAMRDMITQALQAPREALRLGALLTATVGLAIVVLASG